MVPHLEMSTDWWTTPPSVSLWSRFLLLWSAVVIMYPTTLAVIALTFSNYVLQPVFPNCVPPYMATRMLSATCLCECLHLTHLPHLPPLSVPPALLLLLSKM